MCVYVCMCVHICTEIIINVCFYVCAHMHRGNSLYCTYAHYTYTMNTSPFAVYVCMYAYIMFLVVLVCITYIIYYIVLHICTGDHSKCVCVYVCMCVHMCTGRTVFIVHMHITYTILIQRSCAVRK
jgi:hypothetical protein